VSPGPQREAGVRVGDAGFAALIVLGEGSGFLFKDLRSGQAPTVAAAGIDVVILEAGVLELAVDDDPEVGNVVSKADVLAGRSGDEIAIEDAD